MLDVMFTLVLDKKSQRNCEKQHDELPKVMSPFFARRMCMMVDFQAINLCLQSMIFFGR